MENYTSFARIYSSGSYPKYSSYIANRLPDILGRLNFRPTSILDIACGEGTFVIKAEKLGFKAHGLDKSKQMIELAQEKAETKEVNPRFFRGDMREFNPKSRYDLVTSWFDSMNYLSDKYELRKTLQNVYRTLKKDGYFIFDVNTIYGLKVEWQKRNCYVQRDEPRLLELHRTNYKPEAKVATLKITFFEKRGNSWKKYEEVHKERGFELSEIRRLAKVVGFEVSSVWADLECFSEPDEKTGRVWLALRKRETR